MAVKSTSRGAASGASGAGRARKAAAKKATARSPATKKKAIKKQRLTVKQVKKALTLSKRRTPLNRRTKSMTSSSRTVARELGISRMSAWRLARQATKKVASTAERKQVFTAAIKSIVRALSRQNCGRRKGHKGTRRAPWINATAVRAAMIVRRDSTELKIQPRWKIPCLSTVRTMLDNACPLDARRRIKGGHTRGNKNFDRKLRGRPLYS